MYFKLLKAEPEESKFGALGNAFVTKHFKRVMIYLWKFKNGVQNKNTVFDCQMLQLGGKQQSGKFAKAII